MDEKILKSLQTTAQNKNNTNSNNNNIVHVHDEERNVNIEQSETDILYKYQQRHERRAKNGQNKSQKPTKRYGESNATPTNTTGHPTCLKESFYLLIAWFGYFFHIAFALLPNEFFNGKTTLNDFYKNYKIEIAPASWNVVQFGITLLWQGILLTYLSLIIAEHTIKIFPKGFYYGIGLANICVAIWDICTEHESYSGRTISWLLIAICLFYTSYILLKHIYFHYDITKYDSRFRLDSMPSQNDNTPNDNKLQKQVDIPPPLTISSQNNNNDKSRQSRNINSLIGRIQSGGSLNNSPISMSMAPSAAQKLVYEAAAAANQTETDTDWLETKITDVTRLKYAGLIGIVFNGIAYFLSVVCLQFWIQIGVWLVYECNVKDNTASVSALVLIFISILIYYYFDFGYLQKYLMHNFATHIVLCVTFTAMIWNNIFPEDNEKDNTFTFSVVFQIVIFIIVVCGLIIKIPFSIRIYRKYKNGLINENKNDQYKRVI